MNNTVHSAMMIIVIAAVTFLLRVLPFLLFGGKREIPRYILYLGDVLPYAIMGMLVVYTLRDVTFSAPAGWVPSALSAALIVLLHLWKRSTLLSILGGTVCYMLLVQCVF